ncbi:MAG: spore germination protein [Bacillota bacterium]|nr:spore germination protein [Bacillota bacterium]
MNSSNSKLTGSNTGNDPNKDGNDQTFNMPLTDNLNINLITIKKIFSHPINKDFILRRIYIKSISKMGVIAYLAGMVDTDTLEKNIIKPLLQVSLEDTTGDVGAVLMEKVLTVKSVSKVNNFNAVVKEIIDGNAVLFVDGFAEVIAVATTQYEHRAVEKPYSENTIKGPKEAFTESDQSNRSLIRKYLRDPDLITEGILIGNKAPKEIQILYIKDIADQELIQAVKARINEINVESIQTISILEQHIEERPYSLVPSVLATERPDRVVSFLMQGCVCLLMDGSPECLILPVTYWSFFHTSEDYYQRWAYGNFIRAIRWAAIFVALLTPAAYIAISSYHVDMIPTDLVLAIAASRERLPFPAIAEVVIMEISFELIREAGVRVPQPIGPTIGIVGALILGQAAVQANIVSPILVIVIAMTGLASFAIPEISLSFTVRITRFLLLIIANFMGFFGLAAGVTMIIAYLSTIKSFGVPFIAPMAPHTRSSKDMLFRPPVWKMWIKPLFMHPKDAIREKIPKEDE